MPPQLSIVCAPRGNIIAADRGSTRKGWIPKLPGASSPKHRAAPLARRASPPPPPRRRLSQLDVDVRLLAELFEPGGGLLVHLAPAQLARDLLFHFCVRLQLGLLHVGNLEYVKSLRAGDRTADVALLHGEDDLLPVGV